MNEIEISSITKLTNQLREELSLEHHYNYEEQQKIIENGYIIIQLKNNENYKIYYNQFKSNICNMMEEKLQKVIDENTRKLIFVHLVTRELIFGSELLEQEFNKCINKIDIKLYDRQENDIKCYLVTSKNGIYIKESVQLESDVVTDYYEDGIINKDSKIYSDYSSTINIVSNGKEYQITRLHVTTRDGKKNLGWTSLNNSKGDFLMKEIINHYTCYINFRYDDQYKSSKVFFDEFLEICKKMNLESMPEKILIKTFIDLSQNKYTITIEDIIAHLKFNIENEKNKHNMLILKQQQQREEKIKNYTKHTTGLIAVIMGLYAFNKSNIVPKSMRTDITKKILKKGISMMGDNIQHNAKNLVLPHIENIIDEIDLDNMNEVDNIGLIKNVGFSVLKGMGILPSEIKTEESNEEDVEEENIKGDLNQNEKEKKSMEEVDNLLNVFESNNNH